MKSPAIALKRARLAAAAKFFMAKDQLGMSVTKQLHYSIDQFSLFQNSVRMRGWAFCDVAPVLRLELRVAGISPIPLKSFGLPSEDVARAGFGRKAKAVRFDEVVNIQAASQAISDAVLVAVFEGVGQEVVVGELGKAAPGGANDVFSGFLKDLEQKTAGKFLEVGSRARSGVSRRDLVPSGWSYTGLDVMAGPNVDVVGDAHELSTVFPVERFDGVMAMSVLEHLLMPWKFAIELNKVMTIGARGFFITHQSWPMHDEPWDFWRYSDKSWSGLLNKATGFRIIEAKMSEPCFLIAEKLHAVTNFAEIPSGFLSSVVYFEKTGETQLAWPVKIVDITETAYPSGEVQVRLS
jgi:hypothetical protein